jgi:hypothetical protein
MRLYLTVEDFNQEGHVSRDPRTLYVREGRATLHA